MVLFGDGFFVSEAMTTTRILAILSIFQALYLG
jgi:hypothetical protein